VADAAGLRPRATAELYRFVGRASRERALRTLGVFGVEFLVGPDPIDGDRIEPLRRGDGEHAWIYRVLPAGPRSYLASRLRSAANGDAAFEALAAADFVYGEDATVDGGCPPVPAR